MTTDEQAALARIEGKVDDIDSRVRTVETGMAGLVAADKERIRLGASSAASWRWVIGLVVTSALAGGAIAAALIK